jgi:hypothetical protein
MEMYINHTFLLWKHLVDRGMSAGRSSNAAARKEMFIETVNADSEINDNLIPLRGRHVDN